MERSPNRLDWAHWQALLVAGLGDIEALQLPDAAKAYLEARILHGDATQWRPFGNGWTLMTGDAWAKRAKEHLGAALGGGGDERLEPAARLLVQVEARESGAALGLPRARALLDGWSGEYSRFGLLCAGNQLLDELAAGLADWLSAALARKPWPSPAVLASVVGIAAAHARWLGRNPLTAVCFPFGALVQALSKVAPGVAELGPTVADYADALRALVLVESSERRRRDQWVAKLQPLAVPAANSP